MDKKLEVHVSLKKGDRKEKAILYLPANYAKFGVANWKEGVLIREHRIQVNDKKADWSMSSTLLKRAGDLKVTIDIIEKDGNYDSTGIGLELAAGGDTAKYIDEVEVISVKAV